MPSFLDRPLRAALLGAALVALSLSSVRALARTVIPQAAQPQLAESGDGRVWLVYGQASEMPAAHGHGEGDSHQGHGDGQKHKDKGHAAPQGRVGELFIACSTDGGATFGPAVKAARVPGLMLGNRRGPRIAARGDNLTLTMVAGELLAFASRDGGKTWSEAVAINDVPTSAREGLHDLAAAPDGKLFVTWLDLRNGKTELWSAESTDGGRTWSKNAQVYRSPDKSICECCHPSALYDAQGNLAVMWRNSVQGSRDMWMTTRAKGAKDFSNAQKIGGGTWTLNACPMDGGRIVALGDGKFGSVWQRAGEVFFAPAGGAEVSLGSGKQPVAVGRGSAPLILWQQGTDLVSVGKPGETPVKRAVDARFASALALSGGKGVLLAYEQGPAKEKQPGIVVERL